MDELVQDLSKGEHPIVVAGDISSPELRERIEEIGYVLIKFTDTRGGTTLGVRLDKSATELSKADFDRGTGFVHLEGTLTLNYVPVKCVVDIQLENLAGTGHLVILET